jgi:hypothetical protein
MFARSVALVVLVGSGGCGSFIGKGLAPTIAVNRPVSLEITASGDQRRDIDQAVDWIVGYSRSLHRAKGGVGDGRVKLIGTLTQKKAILAGTDSTWTLEVVTVRDDTQVVHDARSWSVYEQNSNVPYEVEKLISQSVVWALERAGNGLAGAPAAEPVVERTPEPVVAPSPEAAAPVDSDSPPLADPRKKPRKKH